MYTGGGDGTRWTHVGPNGPTLAPMARCSEGDECEAQPGGLRIPEGETIERRPDDAQGGECSADPADLDLH
jgi:hypothetical protein